MAKLLIGSANRGKLIELQELLHALSFQIVSPSDVGIPPEFDPSETAGSFAEIALEKARAYAARAHLLTLADDSGLEVTALHGAPGIHSKRFAPGTDHDRNLKLLEKLADATDRSAQFVSVLCLFDPATQKHQLFEGRVSGTIAQAETGTHGFGYDPLFIPDGYQQSFGELGSEVKNQISHRARALQKFVQYLKENHA